MRQKLKTKFSIHQTVNYHQQVSNSIMKVFVLFCVVAFLASAYGVPKVEKAARFRVYSHMMPW